jgi:hypothetical protein
MERENNWMLNSQAESHLRGKALRQAAAVDPNKPSCPCCGGSLECDVAIVD